jgi:hypothetical protein
MHKYIIVETGKSYNNKRMNSIVLKYPINILRLNHISMKIVNCFTYLDILIIDLRFLKRLIIRDCKIAYIENCKIDNLVIYKLEYLFLINCNYIDDDYINKIKNVDNIILVNCRNVNRVNNYSNVFIYIDTAFIESRWYDKSTGKITI